MKDVSTYLVRLLFGVCIVAAFPATAVDQTEAEASEKKQVDDQQKQDESNEDGESAEKTDKKSSEEGSKQDDSKQKAGARGSEKSASEGTERKDGGTGASDEKMATDQQEGDDEKTGQKQTEKAEKTGEKDKGDSSESASVTLARQSAIELADKIVKRRLQSRLQEIEKSQKPSRVLAEHDFISSGVIEDPFVTSYAQLRTVFGRTKYVRESFMTYPEPQDVEHKFMSVTQGARFQAGFADQIALNLETSGNAFVASARDTVESIAGFGGFQVSGGFKLKLFRLDRIQLALSGTYRYDRSYVSKTGKKLTPLERARDNADDVLTELQGSRNNPQKLAEILIKNREKIEEIQQAAEQTQESTENVGDFFSSSTVHWTDGGLHLGVGLTDVVGLAFQGQYMFNIKTGTDSFVSGGAMLSFDLADSTFLPLGAIGYYRHTFPISATEASESAHEVRVPVGTRGKEGAPETQEFGGGLFYTAMKYMDLGVEVGTVRRQDLEKFDLLQGSIRLRSYF